MARTRANLDTSPHNFSQETVTETVTSAQKRTGVKIGLMAKNILPQLSEAKRGIKKKTDRKRVGQRK